MNDDAVTKYALQNEVPSATILNSIDITLETRARARLAGHKFIEDAIKSFRSKYPDWKLCITDLLNELGSKQRAKTKPNDKKKGKVVKEFKNKVADKNDKTNTKVEDFEIAEYESKGSENESEDAIESEGYETDSNKSDNSIEETHGSVQSDNVLHSESNAESEEDQNIQIKPVISSKTIIKNKNSNKSNTNVKTLQVPKLIETKLPKSISNSLTNNKSVDDGELDKKTNKRKFEQNVPNRVDYKKKRVLEDEIKPVCETVDSFFMTADDKDYMSVYKPPPATERNLKEDPIIEYHPKPTKEFFIKGKKVTIGKNNNMGNRRERRQQQVEEEVDTSLHPSWEAKRKQKSLAKFEGKKITFDDQD